MMCPKSELHHPSSSCGPNPCVLLTLELQCVGEVLQPMQSEWHRAELRLMDSSRRLVSVVLTRPLPKPARASLLK